MKAATEALPLARAFPSSKTVYIPVTQGGAPNSPVVKAGDSVVKGQVIATSDGRMSVPVHASVSGTVKKVDSVLVTGNKEAPCVVIEADEGDEKTQFMPPLDPFSCTKEEALARVHDAGIVGMGGAAFPAHVKFNPPPDAKIDIVIANGAECEPYLTADARIMTESAEAVIDGLAIVVSITGAERGTVAVEDNKLSVVPLLERAIAAHPKGGNLSVTVCKTKYPQGGEKMLIAAVTGREVPSGGIPAAAGCIVSNTGTLKAVSEAFREGKPLIERAVTISGGACSSPKNLLVPIGSLVSELIDEAADVKDDLAEVISGGPMMGIGMKSAAFPVAKNTSGVLFLSTKEVDISEEGPCISCGRCIQVCGCRINPVLIVRALKAGKLKAAERYGLMDCVKCGTCAYVCPASIKLVQRFMEGQFLVQQERARDKARLQAAAGKA